VLVVNGPAARRNLHAMREAGAVAPRDVRRHARTVLQALAHCHAHGAALHLDPRFTPG